ncbi:hypothetical protein Bbelb_106120 [Branchiostoma belcheri]|nr:hypothetical protein Bbelb_106120 [Branchiostoma belcheri]
MASLTDVPPARIWIRTSRHAISRASRSPWQRMWRDHGSANLQADSVGQGGFMWATCIHWPPVSNGERCIQAANGYRYTILGKSKHAFTRSPVFVLTASWLQSTGYGPGSPTSGHTPASRSLVEATADIQRTIRGGVWEPPDSARSRTCASRPAVRKPGNPSPEPP